VAVQDQEHRVLAPVHEFAEQLDESGRVQPLAVVVRNYAIGSFGLTTPRTPVA
jgi:hypothetical protein